MHNALRGLFVVAPRWWDGLMGGLAAGLFCTFGTLIFHVAHSQKNTMFNVIMPELNDIFYMIITF